MREFERMKEGSSVETAPYRCRRHESTRNDRSPVRKILVRRHVLLQLDGVGVPSHCHFLINTWRPSLLFGSPEAARSSLSASRGVEFRARTFEWGTSVLNSRVRSNGTASQRVLTWVFSRVCARFSCSSINPRTRLSLADGVQPDCNFRSPVSNRGSPTISKPENEGMPFKRI